MAYIPIWGYGFVCVCVYDKFAYKNIHKVLEQTAAD